MIQTQNQGRAAAEEKNGIIAAFEAFEKAGQGRTPSWLQALHKGGIAHFSNLGFPTTRHEDWRFTNVAPLVKMPFRLAEPKAGVVKEKDFAAFLFPELGEKRVVLVDGKFCPELSSKDLSAPHGLRVMSLEEAARSPLSLVPHHLGRYARYDENSFAALNTAFFKDGVVIVVPPKFVAKEPVHVLYLSTHASQDAVVNARTLIIAQRDSQARVIEHFASVHETTGWTNAVTELVVEEAAVLEHCKIQMEGLKRHHMATIQTYQERSSSLLSHSISIGGALTRNNINCVLDGEGIQCTLNGLYLARDSQIVDHHTAIYHNKPHCNSHEYYHGILDGHSQGVFNGKIFVRPEAQKTDAKQTNRNLLLSDDATVHTKPQLEIFADDVKCTHGATIGQLDPESIFYLRARGIGLENARRMLLHAFASEIVNRITLEPLRERLDRELFERYEKA